MKEPFGVGNAAAGIGEANGYTQAFLAGGNGQLLSLLPLHSSFAVFGQVEKNLH
jgi:hypothetical protein